LVGIGDRRITVATFGALKDHRLRIRDRDQSRAWLLWLVTSKI
jgi:hypothetical protein